VNYFVIRICKIIIYSFVLLEVASILLLYSFQNTNFYKTTYAYRNQGSKFDFAILGSSRPLTSINTLVLGDSLEKRGFNFSLDDSHIGTHELMLKHLLANKISFDTLFLVYETENLTVAKMSSNDYRFLPFINADYVKNYFSDKPEASLLQNSYYFPFLGLGYYNTELLFPCFFGTVRRSFSYNFDHVGDFSYPTKNKQIEGISEKTMDLNFDNQQLNNIYEICRNESIKLIVVITPSYKTKYLLKGQYTKFNVINLSGSLPESNYYFDQLHLNGRGKEKLTNYLVNHLRNSMN